MIVEPFWIIIGLIVLLGSYMLYKAAIGILSVFIPELGCRPHRPLRIELSLILSKDGSRVDPAGHVSRSERGV